MDRAVGDERAAQWALEEKKGKKKGRSVVDESGEDEVDGGLDVAVGGLQRPQTQRVVGDAELWNTHERSKLLCSH